LPYIQRLILEEGDWKGLKISRFFIPCPHKINLYLKTGLKSQSSQKLRFAREYSAIMIPGLYFRIGGIMFWMMEESVFR
jgi:hypothetical protein